MPDDIDIGPNNYRKQGKDGRWHMPDDPRMFVAGLLVAIAVLTFIFITRNEGSRETLFGITVLVSVLAGMFFAMLIKDIH